MKQFNFLFLLSFYSLLNLQGQVRNPNLLVFVGEKITFERLPETMEYKYIVDFAFKAKYKVNQIVFGQYLKDTIEFEVHDHHGPPSFIKSKNVLLYLSQDETGKWIQQKNIYSDVYPTIDGRWAGPYNYGDYSDISNKNINIKPETIHFKDSVWINIEWTKAYNNKISKRTRKLWYPEPYYEIRADSALVKMGNYTEDLLIIQKYGVLEARGIIW